MLAAFDLGGMEIILILMVLFVWFAIFGGVIVFIVWLVKRQDKKSSVSEKSIREKTAPSNPSPSAVPSTKTVQSSCPQCGTPFSSDALAGLCPACLLKMGAADDTVTDAKQPPFIPPATAELAAKFPQLEILELIGKGGMGAVYKARQKQLDRIVALKILPPDIGSDPAFAERFAREAKALAKLNHPNIVTLYEFGEASGQFYFLMEFVDGVNLRQLLQNRPVSAREALAIVPQICDALQFAHDQGIVHRDIKPENILLDRRGRVKVADFGLAKIIGNDGRADLPVSLGDKAAQQHRPANELTDAGKIMGTPNYMSPEQKENPGDVDHRADIYALGVVFYQMLTGELPGKRLEPPSKKVQIDVRLDEIVLRALEKKPELRYQQASVLKTQVETVAADDLNPEGRIQKAEVEPRFSRTAIVGAIFVVVAILSLGSSWFVGGLSDAGLYEIYDNMTIHELMSVILASVGALCLLLATILGWIAISQIRQSSGKIYGMGLAVFDGLFFPLLVLDGSIVIGTMFTVHTLVINSFRNSHSGWPTHAWTDYWWILLLALLAIIFSNLLIIWLVWRAANKPALTGSTPLAAVESWLALMDDGDYAGSWDNASKIFQRAVSREQWMEKLQKIRQPLGQVRLRKLDSARFKAANHIFVAKFHTSFDGLHSAIETVSFTPQANGEWKAFSYFIVSSENETRGWKIAFWCVLGALILMAAIFAAVSIINTIVNVSVSTHAKVQNQQIHSSSDFFIGQTYFPKGDSIEITSVERTENQMTVKGHYNLVSADEASLWLNITATNNDEVPNQTEPPQSLHISKGAGDFELSRSQLVPGLPHVSMYDDHHAFASIYFGSEAEAREESKLNLSPAGQSVPSLTYQWMFSPSNANLILATQPPVGGIEFGPVIERTIPDDMRAPAFLSLRDGTFISPPAGLKNEPSKAFADWWRGTRADLYVGFIGKKLSLSSLEIDGAKFTEFSSSEWENASTTEVTEALEKAGSHQPVVSGFDELFLPESVVLPVTFAVESRTGEKGLLQITGFAENPRGVKIRYKLIQSVNSSTPTDDQILTQQPPVVVETFPVSGARDVEPGETEIRVRFSKEMTDGSWSWSTAWENSTPEMIGQPHYEADGKICVAKVKLEPGRTYAFWLNSENFHNFKDADGRPAVPYLLIFQTKQK